MDNHLFVIIFLCYVLSCLSCTVSVPQDAISAPILSQTILRWNMTDSPQVWLAVSRDHGKEYFLDIIVPNTGSYGWYVPAIPAGSSDASFYVESAKDGKRTTECWAYQPLSFQDCSIQGTIQTAAIKGQKFIFQWETSQLIPEVYISVFKGDPFGYVLYSVVPNTGYYEWEVPKDVEAGTDYTFYVESAANGQRTTLCWSYTSLTIVDADGSGYNL